MGDSELGTWSGSPVVTVEGVGFELLVVDVVGTVGTESSSGNVGVLELSGVTVEVVEVCGWLVRKPA